MTLTAQELSRVAGQFGVADTQVRRDHLLSHLLAVLAQQAHDAVVFYGGTALSRTHLPDGRLSEDLDLIARQPRDSVAELLEQALPRGLARSHGRLTWDPPLTRTRDAEPAVLHTPDGLAVRIQLLSAAGIARWPTQDQTLLQRYDDAPAARLLVPTRSAFAAWKTAAWADRAAARDLYDLWGLARLGAIDAAAARLYADLGPTGHPPGDYIFRRPPNEQTWHAELAGQTRLEVSPATALHLVRDAWAEAIASPKSSVCAEP